MERVEQARVVEREVEAYLTRVVEQAGGKCRKFIPDLARGYPDRIVLLPDGVLVWVETKRPRGGRLSLAQRVAHAELRSLGQVVEVVWSKKDADRLIEKIKKGTP